MPKIGIKLGHFKSLWNASAVTKRLLSVADYIEYQAPSFSFEYLVSSLKVSRTQLRPHGVHLSLAHGHVPSSILQRLSEECAHTQAPFLAEHIGYLNPSLARASLGYILPPPLNARTVERVARAVRAIQKACGVPVALENPVFYTLPKKSSWNWSEFIQILSRKLPSDTGWLIDYAHLEVSCHNLGTSISETLEAYRATGRPVYELHLAGTKRDSSGVTHDDHHSVANVADLQSCLNVLYKYGIKPQSLTLEREYCGPRSATRALNDLKSIRKVISNQSNPPETCINAPFLYSTRAMGSIRSRAEKEGRNRIVARVICEQLAAASSDFCSRLVSAFGYPDLFHLAAEMMGNPSDRHLAMSIPRFHPFIWDGVDLLGPLLSFLQPKAKTMLQRQILRDLLVEIALLQATLWAKTPKRDRPLIFVELSEDSNLISAGLYKIQIDERDQLVSTSVTHQQRKEARKAFFFSDKGGGSWRKQNRSAKTPRAKNAGLSEKRQRGKRFARSMKILTEGSSNGARRAG